VSQATTAHPGSRDIETLRAPVTEPHRRMIWLHMTRTTKPWVSSSGSGPGSCVTRLRIVFSMPGPARMFWAAAGVGLGLLGLAWIFIARRPFQWVGITFTIVGFLVVFMFGQVPD